MSTIKYENKPSSTWTKRRFLGKVDGENIYLSAPSWDCEWYWGFGYLGNARCHYHLDGIGKNENINFRDALLKHFDGDNHIFQHDSLTWTFCELVLTAYSLKQGAELYGRGGSHMTTNPLSEMIQNHDEVKRINTQLLPAIFKQIDSVILNLVEHSNFLHANNVPCLVVNYRNNLSSTKIFENVKEAQKEITRIHKQEKEKGLKPSELRIGRIKEGEKFVSGSGSTLNAFYDSSGAFHYVSQGNYQDDAYETFSNKVKALQETE